MSWESFWVDTVLFPSSSLQKARAVDVGLGWAFRGGGRVPVPPKVVLDVLNRFLRLSDPVRISRAKSQCVSVIEKWFQCVYVLTVFVR